MSKLISLFSVLDGMVTIMSKMAFIFFAYKAIQAMNVYIMRKDK